MNILLLSVLSSSLSAADVQDLGVMSENKAVMVFLTNTIGYAHIRAELIPFPYNNRVTLYLTNQYLNFSNFAKFPSGRVVIGLTTVMPDGEQSETKMFEFVLTKEKPESPKAKIIELLTPTKESRAELEAVKTSLFRSSPNIKELPAESPPMPPIPLPLGTNITYGEHMQRQRNKIMKGVGR